MLDFLRKFLKIVYKKNTGSIFLTNSQEQNDFLNSFSTPKNNLDRSLYQYLCQMEFVPLKIKFLQNIGALFLLPFYLLKPESKEMSLNTRNSRAVFICEGVNQNIIPYELNKEFSGIIETSYNEKISFEQKDKKFIRRKILKYWYHPFFCLKSIMKIGLYSNVINMYNPKAIVVHNEYSYTSSLLTEYCEFRGVEHINVMHGEKLFNIRDSFVKYNRFYVWDSYYVELFKLLRAPIEQFRIAIPESVNINLPIIKHKEYEYTYYLGFENEEELRSIEKNLRKLNVSPSKICIRYHPRYSDKKMIESILGKYSLENPKEVALNQSLANTLCVISLYSTVLYQAYQNNIPILIDDISMPEKFNKLKDLKYIMLTKKPRYFSEV